ncbi:matrixin family metalloprotease [Mangrovimonas sp. CR14]|uniref:matrixin family metalloprotease n=1 Tax=Mangrovimonas sp. CR14 TaxID=2706120 RepID=UPI001420D639|nr:matrixin family metalloprotease [Mangrovimonas sp. CR14]NIK91781.1 matrixin family metalloprotease [Mangrovimonas sp. CR14]
MRLASWLLLILLFSCSKRQSDSVIIGVQAYGEVNPAFLDSISDALETSFANEVVVLNQLSLPDHAFVHIKNPRYRADSLLRDLVRNKPWYVDHVIGVTNHDISTTKKNDLGEIKKPVYKYMDWGVYGLGYVDGPSCVVSTYRLGKTCEPQFYARLKKIAIHEIGHNLGLNHCENKLCVMQDAAETIATIDRVGFNICSDCKRIIK